jgi:hypothetical protein
MKYTLKNIYGIGGNSKKYFLKIERALAQKDKMWGFGWIVLDSEGNEWEADCENRPVIYRYADEE